MKSLAVLIALCICVFADAGTYSPKSKWCGTTIMAQETIGDDPTDYYTFNVVMKTQDNTVFLSVDYNNGAKLIYRFDEQGKYVISGTDGQCALAELSLQDFMASVDIYVGVFYNDFQYAGSYPNVDWYGISCTMYCKEGDVDCIYVKNGCSENCIVGRETCDEGCQKTTKWYYSYFSRLEDMSSFALSSTTFPGCTAGSVAYTVPANPCPNPNPGTYIATPPKWCAYTVDVKQSGTSPSDFNVHVVYQNGNISRSLFALRDSSHAYISHGEKADMQKKNCPFVQAVKDGMEKCTIIETTLDEAFGFVTAYIGALYNNFAYATETIVNFNGKSCRKLCDVDDSCIWVQKDCTENCLAGYGNSDDFFSITIKELTDMSVFSLKEDDFPGCGTNSIAYKTPENPCSTPPPGSHSNSESKSTHSSSVHSSSVSMTTVALVVLVCLVVSLF